jgi:hypothetical protein
MLADLSLLTFVLLSYMFIICIFKFVSDGDSYEYSYNLQLVSDVTATSIATIYSW